MDKKAENKPKSRLIRLNKRGIIIISIIVIIIFAIIGVSVYYGVKDYKVYPNHITIYKKNFDKNMKTVRHRILDENNESQEVTAISFFSNSGKNSNYALYNNDGLKDKSYNLDGPFSLYLNDFDSRNEFKWYGFMSSSDDTLRNAVDKFFINGSKDLNEDNPDLNSKLYSQDWDHVYFIDDSDTASSLINDGEAEFSPTYLNVSSDNHLLLNGGDPDSALTPTITWMWFVNNPSVSEDNLGNDYILVANGNSFVTDQTDENGNTTTSITNFTATFFSDIETAIIENTINIVP